MTWGHLGHYLVTTWGWLGDDMGTTFVTFLNVGKVLFLSTRKLLVTELS